MTRVEIRTLAERNGRVQDIVAGTLAWDGREMQMSGDKMLLSGILEDAVRDLDTGKAVEPHRDPERWLANLRFTYRSPYLRASEPISDDVQR